MTWSVYAITDSIDGSIRYIGQTGDKIAKRFRDHFYAAGSASMGHMPLYVWMKSMIDRGACPKIIALSTKIRTKAEACAIESALIRFHAIAGCHLFNIQSAPDDLQRSCTTAGIPNIHARRLGSKGAEKRNAAMSPRQRSDAARKASIARWSRKSKNDPGFSQAVKS